MNYKYASIVIIIVISFYIAFLIKKRGNDKIAYYTALIDFIEYIKNQIVYFCTPTEQIINDYENDFLENSGFLTLIDNNDWSRAVRENKYSTYLDPTSAKVLIAFGKKLGRTSAGEQIANCEYTQKTLQEALTKMRDEVPKKSNMYSSLAVIAGFMAAILLF